MTKDPAKLRAEADGWNYKAEKHAISGQLTAFASAMDIAVTMQMLANHYEDEKKRNLDR